jgi:hypothetical protein
MVEALRLVDSVQDMKLRINTYVTLSRIARQGGDEDGAARLGNQAIALARDLSNPLDKAFVLADLATAQAAGGDGAAGRATLSEAVGVAAKIADPWARARALSKAASALVVINGI